MAEQRIEAGRRRAEALGWVASALVAVCCLSAAAALLKLTPVFAELFRGLGVELPGVTRFVIATSSWFLPILFVGAAIAVIAKEFMMCDAGSRLATTLVIFVAAGSCVGLVVFAMYLPLLEMVRKLATK